MQGDGAFGGTGQDRLVVLVEVEQAIETDGADHAGQAAIASEILLLFRIRR